MRKTAKKQKNATKLIFVTLITTMIVLTLSLAKYKTTSAGSSGATVATPVITLSDGTIENLVISPLITNEYVFYISNYDDTGSTSQTIMEYTLQITTLANLPLEFELYTYDDDTLGDTDLLSNKRTEQQIVSHLP